MITAFPEMTDETREFSAPQNMTPEELGDTLARLVWESFSDFIADGDAEALLGGLGLTRDDGLPAEAPAEEILIFLMWAHTRGFQLAFVGRSDRDLVREGLDAFHSAIFEDMVEEGHNVVIRWHSHQGDEDMQEAGKEFDDMIAVPFEHLTYS